MRINYVWTVALSVPVFVLVGLWGIGSLPIHWTAIVLCASAVLGYAGAGLLFGAICRDVLDKKTSWMTRRVPGGVWFFVGLGVAGGIVAGMASQGASSQVPLHIFALVIGTLMTVLSVLVALRVHGLERRTGKNVMMSHDGFSLQ